MANHKSSLKRIRQNDTHQEHNRYLAKTMRNALRDFRKLTDKNEITEKFPKLVSTIDKLVKQNIIHKNKAANLKSQISKKVTAA
ncbi:MAG: 30S ribosomal protein S20 [Bacteroidetes bacterium]|nr:30S ribosomal protein S20 [Bacteroidota bacterium]